MEPELQVAILAASLESIRMELRALSQAFLIGPPSSCTESDMAKSTARFVNLQEAANEQATQVQETLDTYHRREKERLEQKATGGQDE